MQKAQKIAVIDIGSNSCRMVIYERSGSALLPYFNEKTLAGLGRNLSHTGALHPDGRRKALQTCRRFRATLEGLGVSEVFPVATAAMRVASDGAEFKKQVEAVLGESVQLLSGHDEGRLSALGVELGFGEGPQLVVDLGGSSVEVFSSKKADGETFLLGPLARADDERLPIKQRRKNILEILETSRLLKKKTDRLIAVGGAWRNVGAVHMMLSDYPLKVVHNYDLSRDSLAIVKAALVQAESDPDLKSRISKVAKKRYDTMLHATLVLDALIQKSNVETATLSAYGLRDGVISEGGGDLNQGHVLRDSIQAYLNLSLSSMAFGQSAFDFVMPLISSGKFTEMVRATCFMADAGARMHPDHRPDLIFQHILRAPIPQIDHRTRLFAAFAIASRYTYKANIPSDLLPLYSDKDRLFARAIGTALRLGGAFSGRSSSILTTAKLELTDTEIVLRVWKKNEDMVSGTVKRRLRQLADLLERSPAIEVTDRF